MQLPALIIDKIVAKIPIIQGGMAVRISTSRLAAAVANEGGIGVIAATGMTPGELLKEIRAARSLSSGVIGINVMFAVRDFALLVKTALNEGIDLVISGAGVARDMYKWGIEANTPIVSMVSSAKLASIAEKLGAAAVIVEGKEAGGHLGTDRSVREIVPEVRQAVNIPVIAAGGIIDGKDIAEAFRWGANGVQMATRFAASVESNASQAFKQMYLNAKHEDVVVIKSPVGLPGRGLRNVFVDRLCNNEDLSPEACDGCLKKCGRNFCILDALANAQRGNIDNALVFCGEQVERIKEILPVKKIFENIKAELAGLPAKEATTI
ncbi:NAD(P)H-dependent flavin oxidoreductase [Candidatus Formimonas warabiya]|uniref:Probable nitronate monooxygenase n=1 Tax=Formimonas warabiya TaxID=1761012 RepID=A0A3G1KQB0_FORW1|nr:nitronate monooxygenase [Candidatus Formimonas warabiya]ATW24654.1 2-nitropropane dioxygenase [Candidatus Formimonas warabiya]